MLTDWSKLSLHLEFILLSAVNKSRKAKVRRYVVMLLLALRFSWILRASKYMLSKTCFSICSACQLYLTYSHIAFGVSTRVLDLEKSTVVASWQLKILLDVCKKTLGY